MAMLEVLGVALGVVAVAYPLTHVLMKKTLK
jgi:hypothetical protein